ncbi:MAG TPA: formylmethanofuran dehydrogenase subunit E family protein [Sedimentisphaerales bacterium]|nr:formylmethanofuran dehydrogenase subunit E family protein [Sedimentisphaerales bacterium]
MSKVRLAIAFVAVSALGGATLLVYANRSGDSHLEAELKEHSHDGDLWNRGEAPEDSWAAIERMHGHVGPWNVLGWRIGQAALREFGTEWGGHELDIICYVPMRTPYTCMADGLIMGTGNCLGRLDIRLAEVMSMELVNVAVHRKDGAGPIVIFKPRLEYCRHIEKPKADELEGLSRQCSGMKDEELFRMERISPPGTTSD